ncbi:hypothetical protein UPA1_G0117 [Ureaplasma parvum serovar 1 str. ATCC 27813]|nr:hypothetical protein UPA1_G0117 [Ureaplasma parvum serovar 1 str. ATCC 27813]
MIKIVFLKKNLIFRTLTIVKMDKYTQDNFIDYIFILGLKNI